MTRISRDEALLLSAVIISHRATCHRLQVGAILCQENRPISWGYNGPPPGYQHCSTKYCNPESPCIRSLHAEANAIEWAYKEGVNTQGATLYITHSPCSTCSEKIIQAGITRVVYSTLFRDASPLDVLEKRGIKVCQQNLQDALSVVSASLLTIRG